MTVRLRPTEIADLSFVIGAEEDSQNRSFILPWPRTEHAAVLGSPDIAHLIIERIDTSTPIGFVILAGLAGAHRCIELRRIVITDKGRGFGARALALIKEMAFSQLAAHRLWLDVKEHNIRARRAYASAGFVEEGLLRECLISGEAFDSLVVMSLLDREYRR